MQISDHSSSVLDSLVNPSEDEISQNIYSSTSPRYSESFHKSHILTCGNLPEAEFSSLFNIENPENEKVMNLIKWLDFTDLQDQLNPNIFINLSNVNINSKELIESIQSLTFKVELNLAKPFKKSERLNISAKEGKCYSLALQVFLSCLGKSLEDDFILYLKRDIHSIYNSSHTPGPVKILYSYVLSALFHLPMYWGMCIRSINLSIADIIKYSLGAVISWKDIVVATKLKGNPKANQEKNCNFLIYSYSSRNISKLLHKKKSKNFVIFPPLCTFLVTRVNKKDHVHYIFLREILIGIGDKSVLWVDQRSFDKFHENKKIIEEVLRKDPKINFVLKNDTDSAMKYLLSSPGMRKFDHQLRIVTNLIRDDDEDKYAAGVRFLSLAIKNNIKCKMLIFTSSENLAKQGLEKYGLGDSSIRITVVSEEAKNFILFLDN